MKALDVFLGLLGQTEGREKVLRLIQYACLHSVEHKIKGSTFKVYEQTRMIRKLLRFLRSLQYLVRIKQQLPSLKSSLAFIPSFLKHLTNILQNLFTILFFLADHMVCLGQLKIIESKNALEYFPRSMKFYFLQNVFGVLHNLISMALEILKGKQGEEVQKVVARIKSMAFDLIRCLLDCLVALYYWKGKLPAKKIGILGVITSVMAIIQCLGIL